MLTVFLCVSAAGTVWYFDGTGVASDSGMSPSVFAASDICKRCSTICLLWSLPVLPLLLQFDGSTPKIIVQAPVNLPQELLTAGEPATVLAYLRHRYHVECSGWHVLNSADIDGYRVIDTYMRGDLATPAASAQFRKHPAYPAVSFISSDIGAAVCLLATIGDIRFFADINRPARNSRLFRFFGITTENAAAFCAKNEPAMPAESQHSFYQLIRFWLQQRFLDSAASLKADTDGSFLSRIYIAADTTEEGLIRVAKRMLLFILLVWRSNRSVNGSAFDPATFFHTPLEVAAYQTHLRSLQVVTV